MISQQYSNTIPARTSPGIKRSALLIAHQDNNAKLATDEKIREVNTRRNDTYKGTWNVRTLREEGLIKELTYELDIYRWNVIGNISEVRRIVFKHINGVGCIIHSELTRMVMCFNPINERIAIIRLHAIPFNISIIQVYAPTTDHTYEEIEIFYNDLQNSISQISKKDILVIQGDWDAKIGKDAHKN